MKFNIDVNNLSTNKVSFIEILKELNVLEEKYKNDNYDWNAKNAIERKIDIRLEKVLSILTEAIQTLSQIEYFYYYNESDYGILDLENSILGSLGCKLITSQDVDFTATDTMAKICIGHDFARIEKIFDHPLQEEDRKQDVRFWESCLGGYPEVELIRVPFERGTKILSLLGFKPNEPLTKKGEIVELESGEKILLPPCYMVHYKQDKKIIGFETLLKMFHKRKFGALDEIEKLKAVH